MRSLLDRGPRYVFVGLGCAAINNALFIGLDAAKIHYGIAVILSAMIMIPLSYWLQLNLTFSAKGDWRAFRRYASILILNPPLSWLLLFLIHDRGHVPMIVAAPILTIIMFLWNFAASHWAFLLTRRVQRSRKSS